MRQSLIRASFSAWLALTLLFVALRVLPGYALETTLLGSGASQRVIDARRASLGLDQPILVQYCTYWVGLLRGDFGVSLTNGLPVIEIIAQHIRPTLALALGALLVALTFGSLVGFWAALDHPIARALIALSLSVPILWTGTLAAYIFVVRLDWLPLGGDDIYGMILPVGILGFHTSGGIASVLAAGLRDANSADYAFAARVKGLPPRRVWLRHLLPNALPPLVSVIGLQFGFLLGGVAVTESLFARPGIGRTLVNAVFNQDYPVVQGIGAYIVLVYTLVTLITVWINRSIDPRIRIDS